MGCIDLLTIEEKASTEDKFNFQLGWIKYVVIVKETDAFIAKLNHQWTLWEPSYHSCKNRIKRCDLFPSQMAKDLGTDSQFFHIKNLNDPKHLGQAVLHQAGETILRRSIKIASTFWLHAHLDLEIKWCKCSVIPQCGTWSGGEPGREYALPVFHHN